MTDGALVAGDYGGLVHSVGGIAGLTFTVEMAVTANSGFVVLIGMDNAIVGDLFSSIA